MPMNVQARPTVRPTMGLGQRIVEALLAIGLSTQVMVAAKSARADDGYVCDHGRLVFAHPQTQAKLAGSNPCTLQPVAIHSVLSAASHSAPPKPTRPAASKPSNSATTRRQPERPPIRLIDSSGGAPPARSAP